MTSARKRETDGSLYPPGTHQSLEKRDKLGELLFPKEGEHAPAYVIYDEIYIFVAKQVWVLDFPPYLFNRDSWKDDGGASFDELAFSFMQHLLSINTVKYQGKDWTAYAATCFKRFMLHRMMVVHPQNSVIYNRMKQVVKSLAEQGVVTPRGLYAQLPHSGLTRTDNASAQVQADEISARELGAAYTQPHKWQQVRYKEESRYNSPIIRNKDLRIIIEKLLTATNKPVRYSVLFSVLCQILGLSTGMQRVSLKSGVKSDTENSSDSEGVILGKLAHTAGRSGDNAEERYVLQEKVQALNTLTPMERAVFKSIINDEPAIDARARLGLTERVYKQIKKTLYAIVAIDEKQ